MLKTGSCCRAELAASQNGAGEERAPKAKIEVEVPQWNGQWVVTMDQYNDGVVGAKSKNIAGDSYPQQCRQTSFSVN